MQPAYMLEKYYHSQGAFLLEEGRYDEAIDCFLKALALDERAYTRADLSRAYEANDEHDKAIAEMNRAIELEPCARYFHERSALWMRKGENTRAARDHEASVELDENYGRLKEITSACEIVQQAWNIDRAPLDFIALVGTANHELRALVDDLAGSLRLFSREEETFSCRLPCPAYCCHFSGEPVKHGVHIGPWKLFAIRKFLREQGLDEKPFLGRLPFTRDLARLRLIPPNFAVREGKRRFVYYPAVTSAVLDKRLLKDLPKGKNYRDLVWINEHARACSFLRDGKCTIHDIGEDPALGACKEFLCLTAFAFITLEALELVDIRDVRMKPMEELNRVAVEIILLLARLFEKEGRNRSKTSMTESVAAAIKCHNSGDPEGATGYTNRYNIHKMDYLKALALDKKTIADLLNSIMQPAR
jgi:tetratricopeptide (TPR) repeat protein